jgi:hypothetical protein
LIARVLVTPWIDGGKLRWSNSDPNSFIQPPGAFVSVQPRFLGEHPNQMRIVGTYHGRGVVYLVRWQPDAIDQTITVEVERFTP